MESVKYLIVLILISVIFAVILSLNVHSSIEVLPNLDGSYLVGKVIRVVDGDTIKVEIDGATETIRLVGVDTPETVHPKKSVEFYGPEASTFTKNLLTGEMVWIVFDPIGNTKDRYGRSIAHIYRYPDGLWVNLELVRQGYARGYYKFKFSYADTFRKYEEKAQKSLKGLWDKS